MSLTGKKRVFRGKGFWLGHIDRYRTGGQRLSDYCRGNNLAISTFSRKLQVLGGDVPVQSKRKDSARM
ncbi:MAG: hypothetical protein JEZ07_17370 [Phycisphaerae bacterium]|nr:hypothetical protein [Phycisphaerae bacterium]